MPPREDPERRAVRILEAAGELVLRWGYDKTTIDDVARAAGVAKGTIYLHWRTREELFVALIRHERRGMVADIRHGIDGDPNGVTLPGVVRQLAVSLERYPLVKAFLLRDREVIGKLMREAGAAQTKVMSRSALVDYLTVLHEHDLVRTDVSVGAQANVVTAVLTGFLLAEPVLPGDDVAADEQPADLMADVVRRVLDPGRALTVAEQARYERATRDYVERVVEQTDTKYQQSLETKERGR